MVTAQTFKNIYHLGVKELRGLLRDVLMMFLIVYCFTLQMLEVAESTTDTIHDAAIAIVDEDHSQLTARLSAALLPPYFLHPVSISRPEIDNVLDQGLYTFVVVFPQNLQRDVQAGRTPQIQINVDATRMSQAFTGDGYLQKIFHEETSRFLAKADTPAVINVVKRNSFNENLTASWGDVIGQLVSSITMLAIILTGSALIRERERGTLEHLMVMPVTAFQIMMSKVWSMALIVLTASSLSMYFVLHKMIGIPINGSLSLVILGLAFHIFAVTCMGIYLACIADSMPQLGMLLILVLMPMNMLSGGTTPYESMPDVIQKIMYIAPTTHMTRITEAVIFRGADFFITLPNFLALFAIGGVLFLGSLCRFRKSVA